VGLLLSSGCSCSKKALDTSPPVLSDVCTSVVTQTSAAIIWSTDEPSSSQVEYRLEHASNTYQSAWGEVNTVLVTIHSVTLSGLQPDTCYCYRVRSSDAAGNELVSDELAFLTSDDLLIGIYYHPWWNQKKWQEQQEYVNQPTLGRYNNRDIIDQHVSWASESGIDFLAVSWWGPDWEYNVESAAWRDRTITDCLLPAAERLDICILYETCGRLKKDSGAFYPAKPEGSENSNEEILLRDFEYLCENYFSHPSYLKLEGRPVVFLALSWEFRGWADALARLRQAMSRAGHDVFLVGIMDSWQNPDWTSCCWFDTLTCYHMFTPDPDRVQIHDSTIDASDLLDRVDERYEVWSSAGLGFVPNVMPGFNDSLNPNGAGNPALPRSTEFFESLWSVAGKHLDDYIKRVMTCRFHL